MIEEKIKDWCLQQFAEEDWKDCFLVEVKYVPAANKLLVYVDSDDALTLKKCQKLSRFLEGNIEENGLLGEKYTLDVSSPGLDRPLINKRQYIKNVGRTLCITTAEAKKIEADLVAVNDEGLSLTKKIKKEEQNIFISYDDIEEIKVVIKFK